MPNLGRVSLGEKVIAALSGWLADRRGAVSPVMTLMIVPIVAALGLALEASGLYFNNQSAQNAADAAAMGAATNNCAPGGGCGATYVDEAQAVAEKFGFVNGVNNTTLTAVNNQACPAPSIATNCYRVTINRDVSIGMLRVLGFAGNQGGGTRERVTASGLANPPGPPRNFCIQALAHGLGANAAALTINGASWFDLQSVCDISSNASMKCNGNGNWGIVTAYSVGPASNQACGAVNTGGQTALPDNFAGLSTAANIPAPAGCSGATSLNGGTLNASGGSVCYTGNLTINGTVSVNTAAPGSKIILYNGANLIVNGTLQTVAGGAMSVIFSGTAGNNAPGFISGGGNLDFAAPTSGTWSGVALYQDSRMTGTSSQTYTGNSPAFAITGLIYGPYMNLTIKDAINHKTGGLSCIGVIVDQLTLGGNASFFNNAVSQCAQAGLTLPTVPGTGVRLKLVQ